MSNFTSPSVVDRIATAISRIEAATVSAQKPHQSGSSEAELGQLRTQHDALRQEATAALTALDSVLDRLK
jgi:hypothetical protein